MNEILISALRLKTRIGVPDGERAAEQEVEVDLRIQPARDFGAMRDDLSRTIDYARVCERVAELAAARPRRLIETLAEETADLILSEFDALRVEVELRKFILPQTRHVAVRRSRSKS